MRAVEHSENVTASAFRHRCQLPENFERLSHSSGYLLISYWNRLDLHLCFVSSLSIAGFTSVDFLSVLLSYLQAYE